MDDGGQEGEGSTATDTRPPRAALDTALAALLQADAEATVAAIGGDLSPVLVPMPADVPVDGHRHLDADSLLDIVTPAGQRVVAAVWGKARAQGLACGPLAMPWGQSQLFMLDFRHRYGVIVAVLTTKASEHEELVESARLPALPPRFARATKDAAARFLHVDDSLLALLGYSAEEMLGHRSLEFIHSDDHDLAIANWMELLDGSGSGRRVRLRHRHRDESWVWIEVANINRLEDPEHGDVLAEMIDISDEMSAHDALRAREQLLAQLTETVPVGLFHVDLRGNLLYANRRFYDLMGHEPGASLQQCLERLVDADRPRITQAVDAARRGEEADAEVGIALVDGIVRHCTVSIRALRDDNGVVGGITGCVEDITDAVRARHELEIRAASDPLTGCLNRTATMAVLQELLGRAAPGHAAPAKGTAVLFVDLDRFKSVNDALGHAAGDDLLVEVIERISAGVRSTDVVGRIGGDEFVVVCPGVAGPADALRIARALGRRVCGPMALAGSVVEVRASIGVAWSADPGETAAHLIERADGAMYRSKRVGSCEPVLAGEPS
ncbi:MAG TPA: sensor domain-containing diguanylate cyclase [Acidimicrobiales bacterium]|nr:sensor domain-containing diguanylate cyclase [Acidimicrobiales bacterium]